MDLKKGDVTIAQIVNTKRVFGAQKVVSTTLDGGTYVQNTGNAITRYIVDIYCDTEALRNEVDSACNDGDRVTIVFGENNTVDGFIEDEAVEWKEWKDKHAVGKFTFIKE